MKNAQANQPIPRGRMTRLLASVSIASALLLNTPAQAGDYLWDGQFNQHWALVVPAGGGLFFTNWNPDLGLPLSQLIPGPNDNVFFVSPTAVTNIEVGGQRAVRSVVFDTLPFTLSASISTDQLTVTGGSVIAAGPLTHRFNVNVNANGDSTWLVDEPTTVLRTQRLLNTTGRLTKTGLGTLTLEGGDGSQPSSIVALESRNGLVRIDGGHVDVGVKLQLDGGDLTMQNGAQVVANEHDLLRGTLTVTDNNTSVQSGPMFAGRFAGESASVVVQNGATVDVAVGAAIGISGTGSLAVRSGATYRTNASELVLGAVDGTGIGTAQVSNGGNLIVGEDLNLGGLSEDFLGNRGHLTVLSGGSVDVAQLTLIVTQTSDITVSDATFATDQLLNRIGVTPTIRIGDPSGAAAFTIGTNNGTSEFDGSFVDAQAGSGSLRKVGSGMLTLNGASSYSGNTLVDGGTLRLANTTGSATGSSTIQVNNGTLDGNGSASGTVIANNNGRVAPGTSTGTLTVANLTLNGGSLEMELAANGGVPGVDHDHLIVTGTATIQTGSTLDVRYLGDFSPSPGESFQILNAAALVGTFDNVLYPDAAGWDIAYDSGAGTITLIFCQDDDGDFVCNVDDVCPGFDDNVDSDGDGIPDGCDAALGVDWEPNGGSVIFGSLCNSVVTFTSVNAGPLSGDFSTADYSAAPLSANQSSLGFGAATEWTVTFDPPVNDLLLYTYFWRGAGAGGPDPTEYTFDQPFTILSGLNAATASGNTLIAPWSSFHNGILQFSGPISSLSVVTTATDTGAGQGLTFGIRDLDSDLDGVLDACDICPGSDDLSDADQDGTPDGCDICDGFDDSVDNNDNGIPDGCEGPCPGDTDGDSNVSLTDVANVLAQFGQSGVGLPGDVDGNEVVDLSDLALVLANFGQTCP